jgi:hypothetical protein
MVNVLRTFGGAEPMVVSRPGEATKHIGSSFFRGEHCNFNPYQGDFAAPDFLERYLLRGWLPAAPLIGPETRVTAFGSCFASHVGNHLALIGYNTSKQRAPGIYLSLLSEGLVNVHSLLGQFEWALEGVIPPEGLWHGHKAEDYGVDEAVRLRTRQVLLETEFFVITLGLSEIWYDEVTGGVFWRAVPLRHVDPARHRFRVCTMAETKQALVRIRELIARHVPAAKLLFTLSPVPLAATFREVGSLAANSVSKAILRAALDEMLREAGDALNRDLFYWPSYEIVNELFPCRFESDNRHPQPEILNFVVRLFEAVHCRSGLTLAELNAAFQQARATNLARLS